MLLFIIGDLNEKKAASPNPKEISHKESADSTTTNLAGEQENEPSVSELDGASQAGLQRTPLEDRESVRGENEDIGIGLSQGEPSPDSEPKYLHVYFETMYYFCTNPYKTKKLRAQQKDGWFTWFVNWMQLVIKYAFVHIFPNNTWFSFIYSRLFLLPLLPGQFGSHLSMQN